MDKVKVGEFVELETGKEYYCYAKVKDAGEEVLFFMNKNRPTEACFARQVFQNGELFLAVVTDPGENQRLFEAFYKTLKGKLFKRAYGRR